MDFEYKTATIRDPGPPLEKGLDLAINEAAGDLSEGWRLVTSFQEPSQAGALSVTWPSIILVFERKKQP